MKTNILNIKNYIQKHTSNMKTHKLNKWAMALTFGLMAATTSWLHADTFGTGTNSFTIDFVSVGDAGNTKEKETGFGAVSYDFRMGSYEISQAMVKKATNSGLEHVIPSVDNLDAQPAGKLSWYEAAAFVNWLNVSTGHQAAYDLTWDGSAWTMSLWSSGDAWQGDNKYRHKDAYYFLPSEDEWFKAAYYSGSGTNYWTYPTASDTAPTPTAGGTASGTAVYGQSDFSNIDNSGGLSFYGTRGQGGNAWEWTESASDMSYTNPAANRTVRGGNYNSPAVDLSNGTRSANAVDLEANSIGFRIASIPEPTTVVLLLLAGGALLLRKKLR